MTDNAVTPPPKKKSGIGCGTLALAALMLVGMIGCQSCVQNAGKNADNSDAAHIVECRRQVKANLKDPGSAEFSDEEATASGVTGTVRSKNSFGGTAVTRFTCTADGSRVTDMETVG